MLARISQYTTALIFFLAMSVVYQNLITPMMEPPVVPKVPIAEGPSIGGNGDDLSDLFANGSWQRDTCKRLQTSDGMLLFQNWEQTNDNQWKLWPVTVVIGRGMSGVKQTAPVIIDSAQGAEIQFTESLDVMSGGAPPIHRGRMIGPVHISRIDQVKKGTRELHIRTANVGIDNRKIWTTEAIEMNFGAARMLGRDLTIHLAGPTAGGGDAAAVLDRMELIYLDQLVMPLEDGGLWESKSTASTFAGNQTQAGGAVATQPTLAATPQIGAIKKPRALISLVCGGRVEYDFAMDELSLRDSVSLLHQVEGSLTDRFDCQTIRLKLNDPTNDLIERDGPMDWLLKVEATGNPAIAKLPSFEAEIAADLIQFNAAEGHVHAEGAKGVQARRGGVTARLAQLDYRFNPKLPKAIGEIEANGPGIVRVDDPELPLRKAQWRRAFRMQPMGLATAKDPNAEIALWVDGEVHAWLTDGGEFQADSIAGRLMPEQDKDGKTVLAPHSFRVHQNVQIDTTAIKAQTNELLLFFVNEQDPAPKKTGEPEKKASPLRQWVVQPTPEEGMVDPVARPRPTIRGNQISAQLRRNESGLSAKKLTVIGDVEVIHHIKTGSQTLPAKLTGQNLQLIDGGGEDVLQLGSGVEAPARFEIGDGFFIGPKIQIRPSDNIVWIDSAGEFQMPTAALPTGLSGEPNEKIRWIKPPHCRWLGQMLFDGRTAVLSEGVDITASLLNDREPWDLHMTGDRLQIDLLNDVAVRDMKAMQGASIQRVALMQAENRPVMVQALRRAPDGVLESKHLIHARQLVLTPAGGGQVVGAGPGWYRGWLRPGKGNPLLGKQTLPEASRDDGKLNGVHLVFSDSMQADMTGRNLDFIRGVRVGVRGVQDWNEAFDAQQMDSISMGDSTIDCERLRFNIEPGYDSEDRVPGVPPPWEMDATGGVVFRTRNERGLLEGAASRAAYSSSKDLFTVHGAPTRAARFRQTRPDGSQGPELEVRTMSIRPGTMEVENLQLERLNLATPPSGSSRK